MKSQDLLEFDLKGEGRVIVNLEHVTHLTSSAGDITTVFFTGGGSVEIEEHIDVVVGIIDENRKSGRAYWEDEE